MATGPMVKITKATCSQIHSRSGNEVPAAAAATLVTWSGPVRDMNRS